jgi:hypothetical protein
MIRYQKLQGVNFDSSTALTSIDITPEGKAMGAVPGWQMLIDPDYMVSGAPRNRALPNSVTSSSRSINTGTFPNGQTSMKIDAPTDGITTIMPQDVAFNKTAWSVFVVIREDAEMTMDTAFFRSITSAPSGSLSLRLGTSSTGVVGGDRSINVWEGTTTTRVAYVPEKIFAGRTVLHMVTFSIRDGLSIFTNGKKVSSNPDDKRPLDQGDGAGEWRMFYSSNMVADVGMAGVLSIDLAQPENSGHRRAIERFLMEKYGIASAS